MAFKPIQTSFSKYALDLPTSANISSFIEPLTPLIIEKLNGLTHGLKTLCFKFEEVKEELSKMVGCVKTESKHQLKQFLFQVFPVFQRFNVEEFGMNIIDNVLVAKTIFLSYVGCLNFLIKTSSDMLFGHKATKSFVTKERDYPTLHYTTVPRICSTALRNTPSTTLCPPLDTFSQHSFAIDPSAASKRFQTRYQNMVNSCSTDTAKKLMGIVNFETSENDIDHMEICSGNTNDVDNEIRFKSIVQCITDRIQELIRSFAGVSFSYDEIRDALMEANRSNGYVVRSGKNNFSDSVYRVRVTRLQMRVEITVEMFGRALRYCEGYDYVLTHTNIFPHNIRMFLHLPVLRGYSINRIDFKEGRNF